MRKSQLIVFAELLTCVLVFPCNRQPTKLNVATVISNEQVKTELCCHMLEWFVTLVISFDLKRPIISTCSKYHQQDVIFETFV